MEYRDTFLLLPSWGLAFQGSLLQVVPVFGMIEHVLILALYNRRGYQPKNGTKDHAFLYGIQSHGVGKEQKGRDDGEDETSPRYKL